jgi:hypothetical protein
VAPENRSTARFFSGVQLERDEQAGSAFLSALPTDPMFAGMTARFNGLPVMDEIGTYLRTFNPADGTHREAALHAGLVFAEMTGRAERMWRDGRFNMHEFTRRGANALLETTLLTPHTVAAKQALGLAFMKDWAEHAGNSFADLAEPKRLALERYGIGDSEWNALRAIAPAEQGSVRLLRPADLARQGDDASINAAVKFMSLIDSETKFGTPGKACVRRQLWQHSLAGQSAVPWVEKSSTAWGSSDLFGHLDDDAPRAGHLWSRRGVPHMLFLCRSS